MSTGILHNLTTALRTLSSSTLVRTAGIYTVSRFVNSAIPFLLMPVLTRHLSPSDYGTVAMFSILAGIASPFIGVNVHGAVSVRFFDERETNLPRYIGNCFWLLAVSTAITSIVFFACSAIISDLTHFPRAWFWSIIIYAACQFVTLLMMTLWQVEKKAVPYSIFQNLQTLTNIGLTILLVVSFQRGWQGRIEAQVIAIIAFAILASYLLHRDNRIDFTPDAARIRHAFRFGIPLIPHALGAMLITQVDRIFITNMVSITETGIYTVGYQIAMIIELLSSSFNIAYVPWLYEKLKQDDPAVKLRIVKLTYAYFAAILIAALMLAAVAPWFLGFFVGKSFAGAHAYTFWISLGFAFGGMYYMVTNYIFYVNKTHILAWVTFFTALCNIVLNYFLIKINGAVGAAQATALALFMSFVLTWVLSSRVYTMPWNLRKTSSHAPVND